jgi:hypothetical protein
MSYQTGQAFRRALETRLLNQSTLGVGAVSLVRLRKLIAFDRFLARLLAVRPDGWMLKGGLALQLRLGQRARTTKDIDVLLRLPQPEIGPTLTHAAGLDLGDWFSFTVQQDPTQLPGPAAGGWRFFVTARVDSRTFETFHVDIGVGDPVLEPAEALTTPPLLAFAGIPPLTLPCYPLSQHLAEKVHAYVKPRASGESTRVKDLVDILLVAAYSSVDAPALRAAIQATFTAQGSDAPPTSLPAPPAAWTAKYRKLAQESGLVAVTLPQALAQAQAFLDPVLSGQTDGTWVPERQAWS